MTPTRIHKELIEGRTTHVVQRRPPLPQKLDGLIGSLSHVTYRNDITPGGASSSCSLRDHRFSTIRKGRHVGTDGIVRDLRIDMCADCGGVAVHDVSHDTMQGLPTGRGGTARKDAIIGWYSGARRNAREYR